MGNDDTEDLIGQTKDGVNIILDPYLAYVDLCINTSTKNLMWAVVAPRFNEDQIKAGKRILAEVSGLVFKNHHNNKAELHHADALEMMGMAETAGTKILFACPSMKMDKVPRIIAEEASITAVAERVNTIEKSLETITNILLNTRPSFAEMTGGRVTGGGRR